MDVKGEPVLRKLLPVFLLLALALTACGQPAASPETETGTAVVATTYPVYLFASAVTEGVAGYDVTLMIDQPVSCLHDYTLSVNDMRTLERADVIVINGAGLEETMEDALDTVDGTPVIDCSQGIALLEGEAHHHADADEEEGEDHHEGDPHIWMDPELACVMLENLADGLAAQDPDNAARFTANAQAAAETVRAAYGEMKDQLADLSCRELITFHDGFHYFARAFDLTILRAIEEEAGSEASAKEASEIVGDIEAHGLPAIFTEVNGSTATAEMIARECGVRVVPLDLIMSRAPGEQPGIDAYLSRLSDDVSAIQEACS